MKMFLPGILCCWVISLQAQTGGKVIFGNIDTIHSTLLNEDRVFWVYTPEITAGESVVHKKYPVVYLLDGDSHFYSVSGIVQQLSAANGNMVLPQMIVVGILNTDRTRDFTPSRISGMTSGVDSSLVETAGGSENFISFLEKELIPRVDSIYPTQPFRVLIGHSLGGLVAVQSLISHTALFNAYVAIDPSLWWDHEKLLNEASKSLTENQYGNTRFFLAIANSTENMSDTISAKKDTSRMNGQIQSALKFARLLTGNRQNHLTGKSVYYSQEDHESVPLIATYDALHFIFDFYKMKFTQQDLADTTDALATKIEIHYQQVSAYFGYNLPPPEDLVRQLGYKALKEKNYRQAISLFKMNTDYYPDSYQAFDSLGDYYAALGSTSNAIACFRKAISLNAAPLTKSKLEKLEHY